MVSLVVSPPSVVIICSTKYDVFFLYKVTKKTIFCRKSLTYTSGNNKNKNTSNIKCETMSIGILRFHTYKIPQNKPPINAAKGRIISPE